MPISPGTRLGAYEILALIVDSDRLARFKREAQVLASRNHPNIAAIYGFAEADGVQALVLESVESPTLAERLHSVVSDRSQYVASDFSRTFLGEGDGIQGHGECAGCIGPDLTHCEVGLRKIPARAQKRHVGEFRRRVRQAIAEVERGLVVASAEPRMHIDGHFPVVLAKGHDAHVPVGQKALQKRSRLHRQARPQDERSFNECGRSDRQCVRPIELLEELETAWLFRGNRDDG